MPAECVQNSSGGAYGGVFPGVAMDRNPFYGGGNMKHFRYAWVPVLGLLLATPTAVITAEKPHKACIKCHLELSPGQVADWRASKHSGEDVGCVECHGDKHTKAKNYKLAVLPDEKVCAECHEDQFGQFVKGKHNLGWVSMMAMPVTGLEPDELIEGGKGCGGCHNMGVKTKAQKEAQLKLGYRYQNNSCDECHTRHAFSKKRSVESPGLPAVPHGI